MQGEAWTVWCFFSLLWQTINIVTPTHMQPWEFIPTWWSHYWWTAKSGHHHWLPCHCYYYSVSLGQLKRLIWRKTARIKVHFVSLIFIKTHTTCYQYVQYCLSNSCKTKYKKKFYQCLMDEKQWTQAPVFSTFIWDHKSLSCESICRMHMFWLLVVVVVVYCYCCCWWCKAFWFVQQRAEREYEGMSEHTISCLFLLCRV